MNDNSQEWEHTATTISLLNNELENVDMNITTSTMLNDITCYWNMLVNENSQEWEHTATTISLLNNELENVDMNITTSTMLNDITC